MASVIIQDCPACGAMNALASTAEIECRDCGITIEGPDA